MPHDRKGAELKQGDVVNVPCRVTAVQPGTDFCNLSLETIEPMHPGNEKSGLSLNTKQVEKVPTAA